jgi:hypothetical protein
MAANVKCPSCGRQFCRRVSRSGLSEILLGTFYIYPFKCQICGQRFRHWQWGVRYIRVDVDRREYERMEISLPVSFSGQIAGKGTLLNVSMGGCSFCTSAKLEVGAMVALSLEISPDVAPVVVAAAVVRSVRPASVGVEFLRWRQGERERLQQFIRGLLIDRGVDCRAV